MPTFAYAGRTRAGQTVSGERSADTMDAAVAALRREQILVTRITPAKEKAAAAPGKAKTASRPCCGRSSRERIGAPSRSSRSTTCRTGRRAPRAQSATCAVS